MNYTTTYITNMIRHCYFYLFCRNIILKLIAQTVINILLKN